MSTHAPSGSPSPGGSRKINLKIALWIGIGFAVFALVIVGASFIHAAMSSQTSAQASAPPVQSSAAAQAAPLAASATPAGPMATAQVTYQQQENGYIDSNGIVHCAKNGPPGFAFDLGPKGSSTDNIRVYIDPMTTVTFTGSEGAGTLQMCAPGVSPDKCAVPGTAHSTTSGVQDFNTMSNLSAVTSHVMCNETLATATSAPPVSLAPAPAAVSTPSQANVAAQAAPSSTDASNEDVSTPG